MKNITLYILCSTLFLAGCASSTKSPQTDVHAKKMLYPWNESHPLWGVVPSPNEITYKCFNVWGAKAGTATFNPSTMRARFEFALGISMEGPFTITQMPVFIHVPKRPITGLTEEYLNRAHQAEGKKIPLAIHEELNKNPKLLELVPEIEKLDAVSADESPIETGTQRLMFIRSQTVFGDDIIDYSIPFFGGASLVRMIKTDINEPADERVKRRPGFCLSTLLMETDTPEK